MSLRYADHPSWRAYLPFLAPHLVARVDDIEEEQWPWRDVVVHVDRLRSSAPVKLLMLHGAGGYGRMLVLGGARLDAEIIAPDLPGYGLTRANRPVRYDDWVDCVVALIAAERARDDRPIVLFGASMGGMLAYSAAARTGAAGIAATCLLDPRRTDVRRHVGRTPWITGLTLPLLRLFAFALDPLRLPIRWLSNMGAIANDPHLAAICAADPLGGGNSVSLRFLRTYLTSTPDAYAGPLLLAHPAEDRWTPVEISLPFFAEHRGPKTHVTLSGCGHFPVEEPGATQLETALGTFLREVR